MIQHLDAPIIQALYLAAVNTGLATQRTALFEGVDPNYWYTLRLQSTYSAQLLSDLNQLNREPPLLDGTLPMERWLTNAALLTRGRRENTVFTDALARVRNQDERSQGERAPSLPEANLYSEAEKEIVVLRDERLPVDFLTLGAEAARKVAWLKVPLFRNGARWLQNGTQLYGTGTGWLLGERFLVTNNHVVEGRKSDRDPISDADLQLQLGDMEIFFDFNSGAQPTPATAVQVAPVAIRARDPRLDVAIVEISWGTTPPRPPLSIRRSRPDLTPAPGEERPPSLSANIIQHPGGKAKQIAVRANLITRSEDDLLWYVTDTEQGSSGSPVLDDRWQVIALHAAAGKPGGVVNFMGKKVAVINRGAQSAAILAWLRQSHAALLASINASIVD